MSRWLVEKILPQSAFSTGKNIRLGSTLQGKDDYNVVFTNILHPTEYRDFDFLKVGKEMDVKNGMERGGLHPKPEAPRMTCLSWESNPSLCCWRRAI
jgi:hypothetical protein